MTNLIDETNSRPILMDDMDPDSFAEIVSVPCNGGLENVGDIVYCDKRNSIVEVYPTIEAYEDNKNEAIPPVQIMVKVLSNIEVFVRIKR